MFDGSSEVPNKEQLDATANVNVIVLNYGVTDNFNIALITPYKDLEATAKLGPNNVAIHKYITLVCMATGQDTYILHPLPAISSKLDSRNIFCSKSFGSIH